MKTIPLRQLVREPLKIKRLTRTGQPVQVTDNGKPLWILQPAPAPEDEPRRSQAIDEVLDELLTEPVSTVHLSSLVKESRR